MNKKELPLCFVTHKEIPAKDFKYFSWEVDAYLSAEGLAIIEKRAKDKKDTLAGLLWFEWIHTQNLLDME